MRNEKQKKALEKSHRSSKSFNAGQLGFLKHKRRGKV